MNRLSILSSAVLAALAVSFTACSKQPAAEAKPTEKAPVAATPAPAAKADAAAAIPASPYQTLDQRVSYGIGHNMGSGLSREKILTIDQDALRAGLADGLSGAKPRVPEAELRAAFAEMQQKATVAAAAIAAKQQSASVDFLAKNKTKPGVTTTASGLQYEVITKGTGAKPKATDTVEVHYHGTLLDGTVFDSSVERHETATFPVTGVIQGWIEALQLMSVGDKFKLYIPPALGYGDHASGKIPPGSVLIFEVELISIK